MTSREKELKAIAVKLKKLLDKCTSQIKSLTEERDNLLDELHKASKVKDKLKESYNRKLQEHKDAHQQELDSKEEEIAVFKSALVSNLKQIKTLQAEKESLEESFEEKCRQQLKESRNQNDENLKRASERLNKFINENYALRQELEKHANRKTSPPRRSEGACARVNVQAPSEIKSLTEKINRQTKELEQLKQSQKKALEIAVSKRENELRQFYDKKLQDLRRQIENSNNH